MFMMLMNNVFYKYLDRFIVIYLDNILVYSKTKKKHIEHLQQVLTKLRQHKLYAKMTKCKIMQRKVEYLGHFISDDGIIVDSRKIDIIKTWPILTNVLEVRLFLSMASYYRKFVKNFATIAISLTDLLHKDNEFHWKQTEIEAFE